MPSSVQKVLIHGADIIQYAALPIGTLLDEDFRNIRESHTQKMPREKTMHDLFHYLLLSSDPLISSFSTKGSIHSRSAEPLCEEVITLLSDASIPESFHDSESESE